MKRTGLLAVVAIAAVAAPAHAQVSEARIQEMIKQAAVNVARESPQVPSTRAAGQTRPVVALTLDDAVRFALERNLDIAVQRLNPEINDIAIQSIRSIYHTSLTSTVSTQSTTTPTTSTLSGNTQVGAPVVSGLA